MSSSHASVNVQTLTPHIQLYTLKAREAGEEIVEQMYAFTDKGFPDSRSACTKTDQESPSLTSTSPPPSQAVLIVNQPKCGTGFLTAVLARMVAPQQGRITAIDLFERQVEHAERDLKSCVPELLPLCEFARANAWTYTSDERFDAIAVAAQCEKVPENLVRLLKPGGRLVCPVGPLVPGKFAPFWLVQAAEQPARRPCTTPARGRSASTSSR